MRTKGIGPNNLGMSPLKVKERDIKKEKEAARAEASRSEGRVSRTEFLDAKKKLSATTGDDTNAKQEVARTRHNLDVSNQGGASIKNGSIIMAPLSRKGKNVPKPKGAQLRNM
jgi:hypothetical protein